MKTTIQGVLGAVAFAITFSGCAALSSSTLPYRDRSIPRPSVDGSWATKEATTSDLLYVSDSIAGSVSMITYPEGKKVGKLIHFKSPAGLCVDKRGDVYILDHTKRTRQIREYAHGGASPIRVMSEDTQVVDACAVDLASGDIAVTSQKQRTNGPGTVAIYPKGKDNPRYYTDPAIDTITYCAYDANGNLFVDGWDSNVDFILEELPKGGSSFLNIKLDTYIEGPGGIQPLGGYLVVGDIDQGVAYRFAIKGSRGKRVSTTHLAETGGVAGFWLLPGIIITQEYYNNRGVGIWKYPKGGNAKTTLYGFRYPENVAISKAQ